MSQSITNISLVAAFSAGLLSFVSPWVLIDIGPMPKGYAWILPKQDGSRSEWRSRTEAQSE